MDNRRDMVASGDPREGLAARVGGEASDALLGCDGPPESPGRKFGAGRRAGIRAWSDGPAAALRRMGVRVNGEWTKAARALRMSSWRWGERLPRRGREPREGATLGAKVFVVRSSLQGMLLHWVNPAFEAATGLAQADLVGRPLDEVLPPALALTLAKRCRECLVAAAPRRYVSTLPLGGRQVRWSISLTPRRDPLGREQLIFGSADDVDEAPDAHVDAIAEAAAGLSRRPKLTFTALPDGRLEHVDQRIFDHLGLPRDASPDQMLARIHPDDVRRLTPPLPRHDGDASIRTAARIRGPDGAYRRFAFQAELFKGPAGWRWYGAAMDPEQQRKRPPAAGEHLFDVIGNLNGCCLTIDREGRIQQATPGAAAWLRMSEDELIGLSIHDDLAPGPAMLHAVEAGFETGQPTRAVFPALLHPGRWSEYRVFPFAGGANVVFWDVADAASRDDQPAAEAFQEFTEALPTEVALLGDDGRVIATNPAWRAEQGDAFEGEIGIPYLEVCRKFIPGLDESAFRHGLKSLLAGRAQLFTLSYVAEKVRLRHRELRITPLRVAGQRCFAAVHSDLGDGLGSGPRETQELLAVQERERQRIAIELHDSTSQHLVALGMGVARLRKMVAGRTDADAVLADMSKSVEEAVKEIRVLSYLMMPPGLREDGLQATVRGFVKGFGARTGLGATFRAEGEVDNVSSDVKHAALRVVQEALSNVYRHAQARGVEVEITRRKRALTVRIADDGKGIPSLRHGSPAPIEIGVGVAGMQARVAQLGGTLQITSDSAGAVVTAALPAYATADELPSVANEAAGPVLDAQRSTHRNLGETPDRTAAGQGSCS